MKAEITARFTDADTAQRVSIYINALYIATSDMYTTQIADGYYSYSGIVPLTVPGANYLTNIFCPVFPENTTLDEIESRCGITAKIRCNKNDTTKITRYIIKTDVFTKKQKKT